MIQNRQCRALSLDARNVAIWTKSGEKIYHGLRAVGNSLTTWAVSASPVVRNFSSGLAPTIKRQAFSTTRKSNVIYISCSLVVRCWIYRCWYIGFNSRYFSGIRIKVSKKRLKNNFLNIDYNYRPVMFERFVVCGAFGFHFGKFCVYSWHEILG